MHEAVAFGDIRVNLAEYAEYTAAGADRRAASRMERGIVAFGGVPDLNARRAHERVNDPLHSVEYRFVLPVGVVEAEHDALRLVGEHVLRRDVDGRHLVEVRRVILHALVVGEHIKHRRDRRRAHNRGVLAERIGDYNALSLILGQTYLFVELR